MYINGICVSSACAMLFIWTTNKYIYIHMRVHTHSKDAYLIKQPKANMFGNEKLLKSYTKYSKYTCIHLYTMYISIYPNQEFVPSVTHVSSMILFHLFHQNGCCVLAPISARGQRANPQIFPRPPVLGKRDGFFCVCTSCIPNIWVLNQK